MKINPILILCLLLGTIAFFPNSARADVGLPPAQPGSSLSPGDYETSVQMVSEQVEIIIDNNGRHASVSADFQMRNNGVEDESIEVWFPFGYTRPNSKAWKVIQVSDLQAWVNGVESEITIEKSDQWNFIWAHWPVSFPAGEPLTIQVSYRLSLDRLSEPVFFDGYSYILETGSGWEGVIEEAVITVQAPYPLQDMDSFLGNPSFLAAPEGYSIAGSEVKWVMEDFEPGASDNINFHFFPPGAWHAISDSLDELENDPDDWEAHRQLARGLNNWINTQDYMVRYDYFQPGTETSSLLELTATSYRKALELSPPDHSLYLSILSFFRWHPDLIEPRDLQEYYYQAIQLFPDNEQLRDYYQRAIEEGVIKEGPPPSPSPTQPEPSETPYETPLSKTAVPEAIPETDIPQPLYLIIGVLFLSSAALLLFIALNRNV